MIQVIYVYLSNGLPDCEDEYLVQFDTPVRFEAAADEALAGLEDYIDEHEEYYFAEMDIDDPTDEELEEYVSACQLVWWPVTESMWNMMVQNDEIIVMDEDEEEFDEY